MFWKVIATFALKQCIKLSFVSRLSRDTRGRRRIIAFLFLYPRRDVHEVSVALYDFLCFEKLLLSLQRERCGFSHVGVLFFLPCFLFFSSSCMLLVVNCFQNRIFALSFTTGHGKYQYCHGCELLSESYLCIIVHNFFFWLSLSFIVVNCFQNRIFALSFTTLFLLFK